MGLIGVTLLFLFADQNLLAPNLTACAKDFHMSAEERDKKLGGEVALGFFLLGAPAAIAAGYAADIMNRCRLFGVLTLFSGLACLSTAYVKTYNELLLVRTLTGVGIGAAAPITFSLMGDYFSQERRIYVSTYLGIMMSLGISFGQFLSGMIGPDHGWRLPFVIVAVPCIMTALLVITTTKEPRRGDQESAMRALRARNTSSGGSISLSHEETRAAAAAATPTLSSYQQSNRKSQDKARTHMSPSHPILSPMIPRGAGSMGASTVAIAHADRGLPKESTSVKGDGDDDDCDGLDNSDHSNGDGADSRAPEDLPRIDTYDEKIDWNKIKDLLRTPSIALILLQGVPGCIPWGIFYVYLNDYLSENKGFTVKEATVIVTMFGLGGLLGQLLGGWAGQRLYNLDPRYQIYLMSSSTILAVAPLLVLINTEKDTGTYPLLCIVGFVAGVLVLMNGPNINVVLQNVTSPETRGTAFAFFTLTNDIGRGGGPLVVAYMVALIGSREEAFNAAFLGLLVCGAIIFLVSRTVVRDEDAVQGSVRRALSQAFARIANSDDDCEDGQGSTDGGYAIAAGGDV